ncbi:MAG: cupin domain-containing protein [Caulobacteraceae bacterium]|nr:cupin domain-containing protein [Caulobacteraceae bacterium]
MTKTSLHAYLAAHDQDPAVRLFERTAAAMRADAHYLEREDDAASAVFLAEEAPAPLSATAFEQALAMIDAAEALDRKAQAKTATVSDPTLAEIARLPSPVREAALKALENDRWHLGGIGIRRLPLPLGGAGHAELMRIDPGHGAAPHDHDGDELTLILTGGYDDGHAQYGPGDVSLARPGFRHSPKADPGEVCYVLAIAYGDARFSGLFGLLQKTIGFPWTPRAKG